jgi:ribosomal protein S18 acetylase RimI-like enzyme
MPDTNQTLNLRPATVDDEALLIAILASTRELEMRALSWNPPQAQMFLELQFKAQQQSYRVSHPAAENNIILLGDIPIGRLLVDRSDELIRLVDIAILHEYRNLGFGTRLISELLDEAVTKRSTMALSVFETNPAIHLYERLGFQKIDEESLYWEMRWLPEQGLSKNSNQSEKDD